ncbi:redoxin domain-containing protein [Sphingomonas sp. YL-JM2C]
MLKPGDPAPPLEMRLRDGDGWRLQDAALDKLLLIVFYRGSFCSFCRRAMADLDALVPQFAARGISVVAISTDTAEQAALLPVSNIVVGHGLRVEDARRFGLFMSRANRGGTVVHFAEPALFLIRRDRTIYGIIQNSMSCGRPDLASLIEGLDILAARDFPLRGGD